jgi:hypothetical protein
VANAPPSVSRMLRFLGLDDALDVPLAASRPRVN